MINDLKDFEKFLKICRKQGVTEVTFGGNSVKLGGLPTKGHDDSDEIQSDGPTDDELIFHAVGGLPT